MLLFKRAERNSGILKKMLLIQCWKGCDK